MIGEHIEAAERLCGGETNIGINVIEGGAELSRCGFPAHPGKRLYNSPADARIAMLQAGRDLRRVASGCLCQGGHALVTAIFAGTEPDYEIDGVRFATPDQRSQ